MPRTFSIISKLLVAAVVAVSFACVPPPNDPPQAASDDQPIPELTQAVIEERINDARVYNVMPESNVGDPIPWGFDEDEPKEIVVVDKQINGAAATIVLDIKTQSSPRSKTQRHLSGQIRTEWILETGWVLRRWEIVNVENISMKYRDLPKPATPENPNQATKQ